jgi:hypothetical protein
MMPCDATRQFFSEFAVCEETADGARVPTHCLYPSFETVFVYVVKVGDMFEVHDGGGAQRTSWLHGRDRSIITRALNRQAERFHLENDGGRLVCERVTAEWIPSAILAIANASALAAHHAVSKLTAAAEGALIEKIGRTLDRISANDNITREALVKGRSGGERRFDFLVRRFDDEPLLVNGVAPHHSSISAKYVSFADADGSRELKLAVCAAPLEVNDTALLGQVATIVPIAAFEQRARRAIAHAK